MNEKIIFIRTDSGEDEARSRTVVSLNAEHAAAEESVFSELDESIKTEAVRDQSVTPPVTERRKTRAAVEGCDSRGGNNGVPVVERRTTTAAVVFFDIVGYTKQSDSRQIELKQQFTRLVTDSLALLDAGERIVLDTGDGAAIGFLQHPTDALETAMHFRAGLIANKHFDYPDLRVRIGIHLGPVSLVKDMNGQINMLGDGINSAQRVMSFAGHDQIYVSRAYFEFVSNLSDEYNDLFRYCGGQQDKHGREHQVYELLDADVSVGEPVQMPPDNLNAFHFDEFDAALSPPAEQPTSQEDQRQQSDVVAQLLKYEADLRLMDFVKSVMPAPVSQAEAVRVVEAPTPQHTEVESGHDVPVKNRTEGTRQVPAVEKAQSAPVFQPPVVKRRRAVPWGKWAAGLIFVMIVALFVVPFVLPTEGYATKIEQLLGEKLKQPVHIGHLAGRILPTPRLILGDVSIGQTKQIQARQAQVNFAFFALFGQVKLIDSLDLDGVQVQGAALPQVYAWLQRTAADPQYPIRRIALTQGMLEADGVQFSDVDGGLEFDAMGQFSQAGLNADGHKLALEIRATPEKKSQFTLALRDSALPLLPNWVFEELKVVGELSRDELRISNLDGRIRGGVLTGDARINWRNGWRVQGALVAKAIPLQNINKLLAGDLDGTARFQMQAGNLSKLADAAVLNGAFSVGKGIINGVDIVEVARLRSRENTPGGRTHFDEMSSELSYANGSYRFSQLKINDSVLKSVGAVTVAGQALSGSISTNLLMRAGSVALQVGGTTTSPSLHVAH